MKVLAVYYTHKPGGFCKRLYRLLSALAKRGHEVDYLSLDQPPEIDSKVCVTLIPFPTKQRSGLLFWGMFILWAPIFLTGFVLKVKPDRYLVFGAFYSTLLIFARIFHPKPIVLFLRSLVFEIDKINKKPLIIQAISNTFDRFGIRRASTLVCMTGAMKEQVISFASPIKAQIKLLPNDLPVKSGKKSIFSLLPNSAPLKKPILLTSGVLDGRKNIAALLEAIKRSNFEGSLIVAGEGPLKNSLIALAQRLSLQNVHFIGWVNDLSSHLGEVDLTVHPSLHEGMSNSILESLAANIPVIASDTPEIREMLKDELLLFNPVDSESLALRINASIRELEKVRQAAQKIALTYRFDWDSAACSIVAD